MLHIKVVSSDAKRLDAGAIFRKYFGTEELQKISYRIIIHDAELSWSIAGGKIFDEKHQEIKPEQFSWNLKTLLLIMMLPVYVFDVSGFDSQYTALLGTLTRNCDRTVQISRAIPLPYNCTAVVLNNKKPIIGTAGLKHAMSSLPDQ